MEAANRNSRPAFSPAFSSCVPGFSVGSLRSCRRRSSRLRRPRQKCLSADRTGPQLRGDAFRCQRRLKLRVKGQDSLTEVTAVRPCPALVQHIAGTVKRKAQAAFPVIVGTHPRDKRTDFLLLVTGQLPGAIKTSGHDGPKGGAPRSAPGTSSGTVFLSFALLVVTASLTRVVIVPAGVRYFLHHSFKRAACKIHSHSSVSSSHGGVSSSSGSVCDRPPVPRPHIRSNHLPNPGLMLRLVKS